MSNNDNDFTNPVYRKKLAEQVSQRGNPQQGIKEYVVPAGDENYNNYNNDNQQYAASQTTMTDLNSRVREAHRQKNEYVERVPEVVKKNVLLLTGLARAEREVKIGEATFTLQTLKSRETKEIATAAIQERTDLEVGLEMRRQQLARSICRVDGMEINVVLNGDTIEKRLELIDNMEEHVVRVLNEQYEILRDASLKSITTAKQAEEVVEALKK